MLCHSLKPLFFILSSLFLLFLPAPVFADWVFDITPPNITTNPPAGTRQEGIISTTATELPSITITATDYVSKIYSLTVTGKPASATYFSCTCSLSGPTCSETVNTCPLNNLSQTKKYNWTPTAGRYTFNITAIDNAGNIFTYNPVFDITSGTLPWIQTTSGDVHSNTRINAPGGP